MMNNNLFQRGRDALEHHDYLRALQDFLQLRENRLNRVRSWRVQGSVVRLRFRDVNADTFEEIGVLSTHGEVSICSFWPEPRVFIWVGHPSRSFGFLARSDQQGVSVILASRYQGNNLLPVYEVRKTGDRDLSFNRARDLVPGIQGADIYDIAIKRRKIYISTSDCKIYQYSGITHELEMTLDLDVAILSLNTGGQLAERDSDAFMHDHLLGVCQNGGIMPIYVGVGELKPEPRIDPKTQYSDTFVADSDNSGSDDIIACATSGKLVVFDGLSRDVKYSYACSDEFYCLYCDDIDNDGELEIFVGSRSNQVYVFGVDPYRELRLKWQYPLEHRVTDVWAGSMAPGTSDKHVVVGLADGQIVDLLVAPSRVVNRHIAEALRELSPTVDRSELHRILIATRRPEMVRFCLEELTRNMECADALQFLTLIEDMGSYESSLQILARLGSYLVRCQQLPELADYAAGFVDRFYKRYPNLLTCERIALTLESIARDMGGSSGRWLTLAQYFHAELVRRKVLPPQRTKQILNLAAANRLADAQQELQTLRLVGIDLLRIIRTAEGVTSICQIDDKGQVLFATHEGVAGLARSQDGEPTLIFQPINRSLRALATGHELGRYVCSHDSTVVIYDQSWNSLREVVYSRPIICLVSLVYDDDLFWSVGLDDGTVVLERLKGSRNNWSLSASPSGIIPNIRAGHVDLLAITLDGRLYSISNADAAGAGTYQPVLEATLADTPNVLDMILASPSSAEPSLVVLTPVSLFFLRQQGGQWTSTQVDLGRVLSSITPRFSSDGTLAEILVGTHQCSALRISPEGKLLAELDLLGVPTAMRVLKSDHSGVLLVAGFGQGSIAWYQLVSEDHLRDLAGRCSRSEEHRKAWDALPLGERWALIALAQGPCYDLDTLHDRLDDRIGLLVPDDDLLSGVRELVRKGIVGEWVMGDQVSYALSDQGLAEWVNAQDQFEVVRSDRQQVIRNVRLRDVWQINETLIRQGQSRWLRDFLLLDPQKWAQLVKLSGILSRRVSAGPSERDSLRLQFVELLCSTTEALLQHPVQVDAATASRLSAFEVRIPSVKFQGFDRMLVVLLTTQESTDVGSCVDWLKTHSDWRLALIITPRDKEALLDAMRREAFQVAALDHQDLVDIFMSRQPQERLLDLLVKQVDIAALSPFQIRGPVKETFYGREHEREVIINSLLRSGPKGHAVIGPRRIGKTSLLLRVKQEMDDRKDFRTVFLDCMPYRSDFQGVFNAIMERLTIREEYRDSRQFIKAVDRYCLGNRCTVVFFLDEVDTLLTEDEHTGRVFSATLRALVNETRVKVVVAGYKALYQEMRDVRSPAFNMLEPVELSALEQGAAYALIQESLQMVLGIQGGDIRYILERTAAYPSFVQYCCGQLVQRAHDRRQRFIDRGEIDQVVFSDNFYDFVARVFLENLAPKSRVLLYLMIANYNEKLDKIITLPSEHEQATTSFWRHARERYEIGDTFTPYDVHRLLEKHDVQLDPYQLEGLMRELVLASIVRREPSTKAYSFVLPDLPMIMRRHEEIDLIAVSLLEQIEAVFKKEE